MRANKRYIVLLFILLSFSISAQINSQFGVSILNYGAKPAKNWQSAVDNYKAIQKAIDQNPGKMLLLPSGIYLLSQELKINNGVRIVGEDKYNTIIQPINNNAFSINSGGVTIENLFIYGRGFSGITINSVRNTNLSNILLQNLEVGIIINNSWNTKISNVDIAINPAQEPKVKKGIVLMGQSVNNHISNSQITATEVGIEIKRNERKSEGLLIDNIVISSSKIGIKSEGILSLHINNSIIDLCTEIGIDIFNTAGLLLSNSWIASDGKNNGSAIKITASWDSHISSNNIKCNVGRFVMALDKESNNNIIINNTIEGISLLNGVINLDPSTSHNIFENNSLKKSVKNNNSKISNLGINNRVSNNIDY